jgi:hypothetical protein
MNNPKFRNPKLRENTIISGTGKHISLSGLGKDVKIFGLLQY